MIFLLSEKPSQADFIAKNLLANPKKIPGERGYTGTFEGKDIIVFPLSGSIIGVDERVFPENRNDLSQLPILPPANGYYSRSCIGKDKVNAKEISQAEKSKLKICRSLKSVVSKYSITHVLLGTDIEYEGAALGVEALIYAGLLKSDGTPAPGISVASIDISNLYAEVLKKSILDAIGGKDAYPWQNYATIGRIRHDFNAGIGIQVSRILGVHAETKTTFGTQQTRLLKEIVERSREHFNFKKVKKYKIEITTDFGKLTFFPESEEKKRDKEFFQGLLSRFSRKDKLLIKKKERRAKLLKSQAWYDGSDVALKVSKVLKRNAVDLMAKEGGLIQTMYEKGYMTYPRGECEGMMPLSQLDLQRDIAKMLLNFFEAPRLDLNLVKPYLWFKDDEKQINHTPYTIASPDPIIDKLSDEEKVVFVVSAMQVLSTFYPDVKQSQYFIDGVVVSGGVEVSPVFSGKFLNDDDPGWKEITGDKIEESKIPKGLSEGDLVDIRDIKLVEYVDSPPSLYNKNSLHQVMKKKKIGTESTFRSHILTVLDPERGFVEIKKGKIVASQKGEALVDLVPDHIINVLSIFGESIEKPLVENKIDKEEARKARNQIIKNCYNGVLEVVETDDGQKLIEKINDYSYDAEKRFRKGEKRGMEAKRIDAKCPFCKSAIVEREKVFSCEKNTYIKKGEATPSDWCPFVLFKRNTGETKSGKDYKFQIGRDEVCDLISKGVAEVLVEYEGKSSFRKRVALNIKGEGKEAKAYINFIREGV